MKHAILNTQVRLRLLNVLKIRYCPASAPGPLALRTALCLWRIRIAHAPAGRGWQGGQGREVRVQGRGLGTHMTQRVTSDLSEYMGSHINRKYT